MQNTSYRLVAIVLFSIVLIVATFFRVYNLQSAPPGLYPDEAMNGSNAQEAIATGNYKLFYPENNGREGLFINIQAQFLKLFGINEPWVLRLASTFFGVFSVLGVFLLILELYRIGKGFGWLSDRKVLLKGLIAAFLGSFLMAISFWHVNFSRIGFRANMAPFFITWTLVFLLKAFRIENESAMKDVLSDTEKESSKKRSGVVLGFVFLSGLVFGLGMHSYIAYRALPLFILVLFFFWWRLFLVPFKKVVLYMVIVVIGACITTAPLIGYFVQNPQDFFGRTSQISVFSSDSPAYTLALNTTKTFLSFFWFGDYNWRHHYAGTGQLYPPVALLFLIGLVFGVRAIIRYKKHRGDAFIFLTSGSLFLIAFLPTIISAEGIPHALRAIIMIPAVFVIVGMGSLHVYEFFTERFSKKWIIGIGVFVLLLLSVQSYHMYFLDWAKKQEVRDAFAQNYVDLGRQLRAVGNDIPKYVVVNAGGVDVRGLPMPTQTIMFLTDTFTPEKQKEKNIYYVLPQYVDKIPQGARVFYLQ